MTSRLHAFVTAGLMLAAIDLHPAAPAVKTTSPREAALKRTTSQPATVRPFYVAELYAKVAGYAASPSVDIGDRVRKGQTLLSIEAPEMQKAYERAEAEAQRLSADITRAEAAQKVAAAQVQQATANIQKSEAQVAADQSEFDRVNDLVGKGVVTGKVKDEAENRLRAAKAQLSSILQSLNVAKANASAAAADVVAAKAAATVADKSLEEMKVLMDYAAIKAPFDGVVTARDVDPGDLVRNSESSWSTAPLFVIAKTDVLRITVPIPERDAVWIKKGDAAEISFTALPGQVLKGEVARTSGSLDPKTRSLAVEIDLPNKDGKILSGMYGTVVITMQQKTALVVPSGTIRFDLTGNEKIAYVVKENIVSHVAVTTGMDDGHQIEILSGLTSSDKIVTGMLGRLKDGQEVKVLAD